LYNARPKTNSASPTAKRHKKLGKILPSNQEWKKQAVIEKNQPEFVSLPSTKWATQKKDNSSGSWANHSWFSNKNDDKVEIIELKSR